MRALAAAIGALRVHWRLALATFFLQFCAAGVASIGVFLTTLSLSGGSTLFDRAVDGDLAALFVVVSDTPALLVVPLVIAAIALLAYAALSWFMTAGLIGVFASTGAEGPEGTSQAVSQFGRWGARRFFAFSRLAVWSLIPYVLIIVILAFGLRGAGDDLANALTAEAMTITLVIAALPALIALWLTWTLIDVARVLLVASERPAAWRAIGNAAGTTARKQSLLAITLAGHLISSLVIVSSIKLLGIGGGIGAFALRQMFLVIRHGVHLGVIAAEVDRLEPPRLD